MSSVHLPGVPDPEVIGIIPAGELIELGILEAVPILEVKWADERQWCGLVHQYLAGEIDGRPSDWQACSSLRGGMCGGNGWKDPCLFREPESSKGWQRANQWTCVTLADGTQALARREHAAQIQAEILAEQVGEVLP